MMAFLTIPIKISFTVGTWMAYIISVWKYRQDGNYCRPADIYLFQNKSVY